MKKLNLQTGGHPFRLDDLIHVQNGLVENSAGLGSAFNDGNAIALQGCVVTGFNNSVSAGYIYYNNEIFKVPATVVGAFSFGNAMYWKIVEVTEQPVTLTSGYSVQYQDTSFKDVHLRRTMVPFQNNGTSPDIVFSNAALPRLPSVYAKFVALDATNTTQTSNIATNTADIASINAAWTNVALNTITFRVFDTVSSSFTTIPLVATNTSIGGVIPVGTVCHFRYKKIGKTVLIRWVFQFSWTMSPTASNSKFRLTLPSPINSELSLVAGEHNIYHNAANAFPSGKFTAILNGGVIDLYCNSQSSGVQYSGAAYNYAYDLATFGSGGITHISTGHMEYEIT